MTGVQTCALPIFVESLSAILSPDQQSRQTAEEQLKVLEVTEGKNVCFCSYFGPIAAQLH